MATVDYFLKLDGIDGGSADSKHKGEIEILSFSFGVSNSGSFSGGGGGGAGVAQLTDFSFTAPNGQGGPKLFVACASGQHLKEGTITLRKAGEGQQEYLKIKLNDILISSYSVGGHEEGEGNPFESFSLNFAKIEIAYYPQNPDGSLGTPVVGGWDVKANTKI